MAKQKLSFDEIMKLADQYGVKDNVLFVSAAERYAGQMDLIRKIQADLEEKGLIFDVIGSTGQKRWRRIRWPRSFRSTTTRQTRRWA